MDISTRFIHCDCIEVWGLWSSNIILWSWDTSDLFSTYLVRERKAMVKQWNLFRITTAVPRWTRLEPRRWARRRRCRWWCPSRPPSPPTRTTPSGTWALPSRPSGNYCLSRSLFLYSDTLYDNGQYFLGIQYLLSARGISKAGLHLV